MSIESQKLEYRQRMRTLRGALSSDQQNQVSASLSKYYQQQLAHYQSKKIAIYLQHDNEAGTAELIQHLFSEDAELYLPKIANSGQGNTMQFIRYRSDTQMIDNRYGIAEPDSDETIDVQSLDMIFLPLTAFDKKGHRLGMGGGYYDRLLSSLDQNNAQPRLVGLAHDFQQIERCPVESFDQRVHFVLTPSGLITI